MTRTGRLLRYLAVNAVLAVTLYFATFRQVEGAQNLLTFAAVVVFLIACTSTSDEARATVRELGLPVPGWVDVLYDLVFTCVLVWFGHWFLGILWIGQLILLHVARLPETEAP